MVSATSFVQPRGRGGSGTSNEQVSPPILHSNSREGRGVLRMFSGGSLG